MSPDYGEREQRRTHSQVAALALTVAIAAAVGVVVLVVTIYLTRADVSELEKRYREQHEELVELRARVERLDGVLDRALDAASIARAVLEESREQ